jgi:DNA-binding MarR family transcriptional regulator
MAAETNDHALTDDVNWLLNRVWLGFGEHRAEALAPLGLTVREHVILQVLSTTDATQLQLGQVARIDKSIVTLTLDSLEQKGFVVREADARDRRAKRPRLTPAGIAVCRDADRETRRAQQELLALLPAESRDGFVAILRQYAFGAFAGATDHPQA